MQYLGSKLKIAKDILPIILRHRKQGQFYYEPFMGGANTFSLVPGPKIGNDLNRFLISMWKGLLSGRSLWNVDYSKTSFRISKNAFLQGCVEDEFIAAAHGFIATYSGKFFDSYCITNKAGGEYIGQKIRSIERQVEGMKGALLYSLPYYEVAIPENTIIYADPPYKNTTKYNHLPPFDHALFFDWLRVMHWLGHTVFVSEYSAPSDFLLVWERSIATPLGAIKHRPRTERLYTLL